MARTVEAIAGMAGEAERDGVEAIAAVGTAWMRIASNAADLVEAVRKGSGVEIEVIPGEEEARLAYLAATSGLGVTSGSLVVFDTGGGSSQFTFGAPGRIDEQFSVNGGAARFTEQFGLDRAVSAEVVAEARRAIAADLSRLDGRPVPDLLVGLGGGITNMAAVKPGLARYDAEVVQGTGLDTTEIDRQIDSRARRPTNGGRSWGSSPTRRVCSRARASSAPCARSSVATHPSSVTGSSATACWSSASARRRAHRRERRDLVLAGLDDPPRRLGHLVPGARQVPERFRDDKTGLVVYPLEELHVGV
jgi:hypothetical protein